MNNIYEKAYALNNTSDPMSAASVLLDEFERLVSLGRIEDAKKFVLDVNLTKIGTVAVIGLLRSSKRIFQHDELSEKIEEVNYVLRGTGIKI